MLYRLIAFLLINFGALGIGSFFTNPGVSSDWYQNLNQAPWTPPGWMFGFAWTSIMICFSIYLAYLWPQLKKRSVFLVLFVVQWILNVAWNPIFFHFQQVGFGLIVIIGLTIMVGYFLVKYYNALKLKSLLIAPYFIWLLVASSLNAYILIFN